MEPRRRQPVLEMGNGRRVNTIIRAFFAMMLGILLGVVAAIMRMSDIRCSEA
ncbi:MULTISPECIES: hypothetical protein [unclassified Mesorhizobium]|uniref:hypothetical protein n=1 Tax=unclassified Mesorhizobium TaxID=325217 RepID=UPI0015CE6059|nr:MULTISPECIES: hypothetical protein [unclassified Mesorhizobium]